MGRGGPGGRAPRPGPLRRCVSATGLALLAAASLLLMLWVYGAERPLIEAVRAALRPPPPAPDLSCYEDRPPAAGPGQLALPDAAELRPDESSIFFLETACAGGGGLSARQACAVESAARAHPARPVYVLVAGAAGAAGWSAPARSLLAAYGNVRVARVVLARYVRGSPLERWLRGGALLRSRWPVVHTSDALRYLTLWRFGGTYLDLDVLVTRPAGGLRRPLDGLQNFAGAESDQDVANGALGFARDELGRRVAAACLRELRDDFRGDEWGHNGPGVISRVLRRLCGVGNISEMTAERCQGFSVLPPAAFYPVPWRQWRMYFEEESANRTMALLEDSYGAHVWNHVSAAANVTAGSRQPYAQLARRYCPHVHAAAGPVF